MICHETCGMSHPNLNNMSVHISASSPENYGRMKRKKIKDSQRCTLSVKWLTKVASLYEPKTQQGPFSVRLPHGGTLPVGCFTAAEKGPSWEHSWGGTKHSRGAPNSANGPSIEWYCIVQHFCRLQFFYQYDPNHWVNENLLRSLIYIPSSYKTNISRDLSSHVDHSWNIISQGITPYINLYII